MQATQRQINANLCKSRKSCKSCSEWVQSESYKMSTFWLVSDQNQLGPEPGGDLFSTLWALTGALDAMVCYHTKAHAHATWPQYFLQITTTSKQMVLWAHVTWSGKFTSRTNDQCQMQWQWQCAMSNTMTNTNSSCPQICRAGRWPGERTFKWKVQCGGNLERAAVTNQTNPTDQLSHFSGK